MIELATGRPPWSDLAPMAVLFKLGTADALPDVPSFLSPVARHFLSLCFIRYRPDHCNGDLLIEQNFHQITSEIQNSVQVPKSC